MEGILIRYNYAGDGQVWERAIRRFLDSVDADKRLQGSFSYMVSRVEEGPGRVHLGRWDSDATLEHLKAQPFFAEFGAAVKGFGGDTLDVTDLLPFAQTHPLETD